MNIPSMMNLAKKLSSHSDYRVQVGAVIVKAGNVIGVGFNKNKTHPKTQYGIHAEMSAVLNAGRERIPNGTILVYRETADGVPAYARPCPNCLKMIQQLGITTMIYSYYEDPFYIIEEI